ncbi:MAG: CPBP family intramembrane metalloprotease [Methanobacterium sp.]|uniref:CPBP family intramembrane glutamic endopeptidase n=1 Tax=Methanobacterium sp. TaxID=2164 RepID=UPI003D65E10F|nr:CPBP family intramembrane metalloprotease [Methanobacterium sp.]
MDSEAAFYKIKVRYIALLIIVGMILFFMFIGAICPSLGGPEKAVIAGLFFYALIALWITLNFNKYDVNYKKFVGTIPYDINWLEVIAVVFAIIILSLGFTELRIYILSTINPDILSYVPGSSTFYSLKDSPMAPFLNFMEFIIGVLIAPIVEEFLFRGVMLHRFTVKWGIRTAVLVSSFIFGILHADILGAFLFGVVMCILYIRTGTIIVPIICHMLNNLIAYGTQMLGTFAPKVSKAGTVTHIPNLELAIFLMIFSGVIIGYYIYRNWPRKYWVSPYFRKYDEEY